MDRRGTYYEIKHAPDCVSSLPVLPFFRFGWAFLFANSPFAFNERFSWSISPPSQSIGSEQIAHLAGQTPKLYLDRAAESPRVRAAVSSV